MNRLINIHRHLLIKYIESDLYIPSIISDIEDFINYSGGVQTVEISEVFISLIEAFMRANGDLPLKYIGIIELENYKKFLREDEYRTFVENTNKLRFREDVERICHKGRETIPHIKEFYKGKKYIFDNLNLFDIVTQNMANEYTNEDLNKSYRSRVIFNILYKSPRGQSNYPELKELLLNALSI